MLRRWWAGWSIPTRSEILLELSSILLIPPSLSPSPVARTTQCTHQAHLGLLSAGVGGEWIGPPYYKGPSYLLPTLPMGGEGSGTLLGLAGVAQVESASLFYHPSSRHPLPLWRVPLPPTLLLCGAGLGVVLPPRKGWWRRPLRWPVFFQVWDPGGGIICRHRLPTPPPG